ncbi:MAG: DUF4440 domain-containing protein [Melioribacteraceae bacterium]|nr:DUF4440 domain-containing protein [Melioribacteraceae bacterium]
MKNLLIIVLVLISFNACTKEVPENEKRNIKSIDEAAVREVIENYFAAYNSGDIETAAEYFDNGYKVIATDSLDISGYENAKEDLLQYHNQYPKGKWENKIEEIIISDGYAYVVASASFMQPDPLTNKLSPTYSERSIRILKKDKNKMWKLFRYLSAPTFTYGD